MVIAVCYPEHAAGLFELGVFGETLTVTLAYYLRLLRGWALGGYLSVVITRMLSASHDRCNPLAGIVSSMLEADRQQSRATLPAGCAAQR